MALRWSSCWHYWTCTDFLQLKRGAAITTAYCIPIWVKPLLGDMGPKMGTPKWGPNGPKMGPKMGPRAPTDPLNSSVNMD